MSAWAYYNEWDEPTAAWLRELIARGLVAPGEVDTRSITEVSPDDLRGFTQCHFFAGIGGWSYALRLAGWPDDRPVWTGSPPCQPFSMAGKRDGYDDDRHLAPAWLDLVKVCAPDRLFGEQVSGAISKGWLDALQHELEAEGYACGAVVLASCGVGAPNIRSRLYFAAERLGDGDGEGSQGRLGSQGCRDQQPLGARGLADGVADATREQHDRGRRQRAGRRPEHSDGGDAGGLADRDRAGCSLKPEPDGDTIARCEGGQSGADPSRRRDHGRLADADGRDARAKGLQRSREHRQQPQDGGAVRRGDRRARPDAAGDLARPGPTNGFWRDADWLFCRDGSWRPVEPGVEPLADGVPARVVVVCAACQTETRWVNGAASETRPVEALQSLRCADGAQTPAERRFGGDEFVQSSSVLQSALLRLDASQDASGSPGGASASAQSVSVEFLRAVRRIREARAASYGREPVQQYSGERGGSVPTVPSGAPCEAAAAVYMRGLRRLIHSAVTPEPSQDLFCPVCERVGAHQCRQEMGSRTVELRGYGNAINPVVAAAFIEAATE